MGSLLNTLEKDIHFMQDVFEMTDAEVEAIVNYELPLFKEIYGDSE